ncbi:hypothetical protein MRX96_003714 [Rhipicephalus microplus]
MAARRERRARRAVPDARTRGQSGEGAELSRVLEGTTSTTGGRGETLSCPFELDGKPSDAFAHARIAVRMREQSQERE